MVVRALWLFGALGAASAFYLPGVSPTTYSEEDRVKIRVNKLTSSKTLLPVRGAAQHHAAQPHNASLPQPHARTHRTRSLATVPL